ncbi:MAG: hypothetical protein J6X18_17090 [Bacteroidales bacterium]|nr:hypothetical protein [Bacteroidales bacterium]
MKEGRRQRFPFLLYICIVIELVRIYGILESFLGASKQGGYVNDVYQYQFNCPYCADEKGYTDGKYNLECNLQNLVFHCWSCNNSGSLSRLIRRYGGGMALTEYYELVKSLRSSSLYEFGENAEKFVEKPKISLPKTYRKINLRKCNDKYLVSFLKKRKIGQFEIDKFKIGYTTWKEEDRSWAGRIIIPSYGEFGELNYFVGRDYMPEKEGSTFKRIKYKNCDADKKEIVFQESLINWDADIYLCEGAIDCLMAPNAISLLGKTLSADSELYKKLYSKANSNIIICLDSDTKIEETKKIYKLLNTGRLMGKIKYIRLGEDGIDGKDFSEIFERGGIKAIANTLRKEKKFSDIDLLY